jgi:phenylacetate-CoA ligase
MLDLIDVVTGFELNKGLEKVIKMDTWNRSQIEQYQHEKFEKLKFYASKSDNYRGCQTWNLKDFPKYPLELYRNHPEKFRTNFRKIYAERLTSGSTGTPKKVFVSKEMLEAKRVSYLKMLHWHNLKLTDCEVYIGGDIINFKTKIYYYFKNKIYLTSFNIDKETARHYIKKINRSRPKIIFSYPHSLHVILNYAEELNLSVFQPELVYTGAELLYPETMQIIKRHFPESHLANEYWATEGNIGVTCPEGNMHVDEDTVMVEVDNVDDNGVGDLLLTNLFSYDFPIIRYPLGDKIKLSDKLCNCGRKTKVIEKMEGRSGDFFYRPDGRCIAYLDTRIAKFTNSAVIIFQLIYHKEKDRMLLNYIPKKGKNNIDKEGLTKYFKKYLDLDLAFEETDKIEFNKSGKYQPFISV